jgi:hypothetical protein
LRIAIQQSLRSREPATGAAGLTSKHQPKTQPKRAARGRCIASSFDVSAMGTLERRQIVVFPAD